MTDDKSEKTPRLEVLRAHAESRARAEEALVSGTLPPQDARQLLHDLRVHEIELSMQNDELRRIQVEVDTERARYFELYDLAPVSYLTLGADGIILEANLTAATLLGQVRGALLNRAFTGFINGPDQDEFYRLRRRLADTGTPQVGELRLVRSDGAPVWVRLNATVAPGEAGASRCWLVATDITDRKRAEEERARFEQQVQQSQRLESLGVLAGGLAHDFNNLLGSVFGYMDLALDLVEPGSEAAANLARAGTAIERARALTRQLLTFARGGAPVRRAVAPAALVTEAVKFALSGSSVVCTFELPEDLAQVDVDAGQMGQVLDNLVRNAIEATPNGGPLTVSAANVKYREGEHPQLRPGAYVRIAVRDSGCGIPRDIVDRIFDPFFTTKVRGSGLGLSIVHSIVKRHQGCVEVASEPGRGTVFHVFLPAHDVAAPLATAPSTTSEAPRLGGRALVMDDDAGMCSLLSARLTRLGYRVTTVAEGESAIEAVRSALVAGDPYQVAFLDLTIVGGLGGKATMARLRPLAPELWAVVISGYSDDPVMAQPRDHGFAASLAKPFTYAELQAVLRSSTPT